MFMLNVDELVDAFCKLLESTQRQTTTSEEIKIIQDGEFRRFKSTVDLNLAAQVHFWQK